MKGLLIRTPWIDLILSGKKTWEIRGHNVNIRGTVALIKSGSGQVLGTADLVHCRRLSRQEYETARNKHCISSERDEFIRYSTMYAWMFCNPIRFATPVPYQHKHGCVSWVNLDETVLEAMVGVSDEQRNRTRS